MPEKDLMTESIRDILQKRPELDQAALSDYLFDEFGVRVCQATISRILKKNGIPHKISNKWYKKSKLFTTHGGQVVIEDPSRTLAATALSELPTSSYESYKSPYGSKAVSSTDFALNLASASVMAPVGMGFGESLVEASDGVLYSYQMND